MTTPHAGKASLKDGRVVPAASDTESVHKTRYNRASANAIAHAARLRSADVTTCPAHKADTRAQSDSTD